MRKLSLASLPLMLLSCAINTFTPIPIQPVIDALDLPERIADNWPEPYEARVKALLPEPRDAEYEVRVSVAGPGLTNAITWILLDDGDAYLIAQPGTGQLEHSGDNVPGDGTFTALLTPDFSVEFGEFAAEVVLLEGGVEVDRRTTLFQRVHNEAPVILALEAPDSLASGDSLQVEALLGDPDGAADLARAWIHAADAPALTWTLEAVDDSLWRVLAGPEVAVGRAGAHDFRLVAEDLVGQQVSEDFSLHLENEAPDLLPEQLQFWREAGDDWEPIAAADTIFLQIPAAGLVDSLRITVGAEDPQTLADIDRVIWQIVPEDSTDIEFFTMADEGPGGLEEDDTAGDGVFSSDKFPLAGQEYTFYRYDLRILAFDRLVQAADPLERKVILVPHDASPPGSPGLGGTTGRSPVPFEIQGLASRTAPRGRVR